MQNGIYLTSFCYPILSIERLNNGLFGYRHIVFVQAQNSNGQTGWVGQCYDSGLYLKIEKGVFIVVGESSCGLCFKMINKIISKIG